MYNKFKEISRLNLPLDTKIVSHTLISVGLFLILF